MLRLLYTIAISLLIGVSIHVGVLVIGVLKTHDFNQLNIFKILDLDLLFPKIVHGKKYFILSIFFYLGLLICARVMIEYLR